MYKLQKTVGAAGSGAFVASSVIGLTQGLPPVIQWLATLRGITVPDEVALWMATVLTVFATALYQGLRNFTKNKGRADA